MTTRVFPLVMAALAAAMAGSAQAQSVSGPARAVDGDTLDMTGARIRLYGIDAVESAQGCARGGAEWACGAEAKRVLAALVANRPVTCEQRDIDVYGRIVAVCRAGGLDLSEVQAGAGLAIALGDDYAAFEARAKANGVGIWAGPFDRPSDYRAAHPQDFRPPAPPRLAALPAARTVAGTAPRAAAHRRAPQSAGVYYKSCAVARAAGAAPIYRGEPGYRPILDADNDGVACEPLPRGRR